MSKPEPFDQPGRLMEETRRLLMGRDLLKIYTETGIPYYWLRSFVSGKYQNPSVNRVQYLYEHLAKDTLI
jgi:hypothetical protein